MVIFQSSRLWAYGNGAGGGSFHQPPQLYLTTQNHHHRHHHRRNPTEESQEFFDAEHENGYGTEEGRGDHGGMGDGSGSSHESDDDDDGTDDAAGPSLTRGFASATDLDAGVLRLCGLYTLSYIGIAVVAYSFCFEPSWTVIDSVYFAVATFTTCGYGDLQPTTTAGQLFTIVFAIYGVIILGVFLGVIGHAISEAQGKALRQIKRGREGHMLQALFRARDAGAAGPPPFTPRTFLSDHVSLMDDVKIVLADEAPEILVVALGALILGLREGWSLTAILYFTIMSASTTGYGDYAPKTQIDKLYCVFFLPLAVAVFGEVLARIAGVYIGRKQREAEAEFLRRTMTLCDLRAIDTNDDGQVEMTEFVFFMLVSLQKVDREYLDELQRIFQSMDTNGNGVLEKSDLVAMAMKRIPAPILTPVQE